MSATSNPSNSHDKVKAVDLDPTRERLAELERRSLLAEQARQHAHSLRSPLSVIELISETLQLELGEDRERAQRIQRVLDAVSTLSTNLTQTVRSNRFADGPKRPVDAAGTAAEVVLAFGGRVADGVPSQGQQANGDGSSVWVDEQGFQAALVHLLRLIGVGHACNGVCAQQPILEVERDQDGQRLRLRLTSEGRSDDPVPTERADYWLMLKAAERVARENDGLLVVGLDHATFELPLAHG
ncbi:MAG: hypothetical protein GVY22_12840 [Gammaproteobacteria bacterium]|jgi:signal transduction histidine kinase|nr:hypothetical protein [Gammaproteobacteria bacterium]